MRLGRDFDWVILICAGILAIIGLSIVYSVSYTSDSSGFAAGSYFGRQLLWLGLGSIFLFVTVIIPFRVFESLAYFVYGICLVFFAVVLILPARGQTQRWL